MKGVLVGDILKGQNIVGERNEGFRSRASNALMYVDLSFVRFRGGLSDSPLCFRYRDEENYTVKCFSMYTCRNQSFQIARLLQDVRRHIQYTA